MLKFLAFFAISARFDPNKKKQPRPVVERERRAQADPYDELTTRSFNTLVNSGAIFKQL